MRCPLCDTELPEYATTCTRCDWVAESPDAPNADRDRAAALLSLAPGLGHLYKGHVLLGGLTFFVVGPLILALTLALVPATLGVILIIPVAFMLTVLVHAYHAPDLRAITPVKFRE